MENNIFKEEAFSKDYQNYMCPVSKKLMNLAIKYLEEKKGRPFDLALDIGCGTGRSTRPLAEHFSKVIGTDISESQINEARRSTTQKNIIYRVLPAEKMPVEDSSVDLIYAECAAHWFPVDKFVPEVTRVLKNRGCVVLQCMYTTFTIQYKNGSETLTKIYNKAFAELCHYEGKIFDIIKSQYQEMLSALPFADKQRISDIKEMFHLTLKDLLNIVKSTFMYHKFVAKDRAGATDFIQSVEKKMVEAMGGLEELSGQETLEFHVKYFCVLACKS